jgi:hypothetical protein
LASLLQRQFKSASGPIASVSSANGRALVVAQLPVAAVGSADAAASTVRARSALVEKVVNAVAVPPAAAAAAEPSDSKQHLNAQRTSLVKRDPKSYSAAVESATGVSVGRALNEDEMLELKKHCGYVLHIASPAFPSQRVIRAVYISQWLSLQNDVARHPQDEDVLQSQRNEFDVCRGAEVTLESC